MPGFEIIGPEERAAVNELFDDGAVLFRHGFDGMRKSGRYRVAEFERAFAEAFGVRHALAVTSGTAAVKVALRALGIGPGDEVITQAFTFVATVEAIVDLGATPILVNVDETFNMDPQVLKRAITPRTRAIVPVHMLGVAADLDAILSVATAAGVPVLEDNCEALGACWQGRALGTFGLVGVFSFDFGKALTTGEGGMVVTNNEAVDRLAREYHDHGHENNPRLPRGRDTRRIHGFNYRMTEIQGAIGLAQLRKLPAIVEANRRNYAVLEAGLRDLRGLELRRIPGACAPLCDTLIFQLPTAAAAIRFAERMAAVGLNTKVLPDAVDWHFAGSWDHIFSRFGVDRDALKHLTQPTGDRLARAIALPVMVTETQAKLESRVAALREIASEVL